MSCSGRVALTELIRQSASRQVKLPTTVAISVAEPLQLLSYLVCLDGYIQTLILISPESSPNEIKRRLQYFDPCTLITDNKALPNLEAKTPTGNSVASPQHYDTKWVLATSGTTAKPKQVAHTFRSLTRTTKVGNGSKHIWGVLYDPYRYAGLQVLLQGLLGGGSVVFPNRHQSIQKQVAFLVDNNVTALSATPTLWRKILMCETSRNLDLRTISLGGEIVNDTILRSLAYTFPNASIRHIYASTEAGTGFSVSDNRAGFPASFLTNPPNGIELEIRNQTLHLKNPNVESRYIEDNKLFSDSDNFIDTGDKVTLEGDRVHFQGRASGVINVGGNKVFPEHVENSLLSVKNVSFARVYGKPNPIVGQLVVADIVAANSDDIEQTRIKLDQKAKKELQAFERPTHYNFVESIDLTPNGKVIRS